MQPTYTDQIRQQQQPQPPSAGQPDYSKIGGWLILITLGLIVAPIRISLLVFNDLLPVFKPEIWSVLTTPGSEAYHPLWKPLLIGELVGNLLFVAFSVILVVLLFQRKRIFPKLAIAYLVSNLIFVVADAYVVTLIPVAKAQGFDSATIKEITRSVVGAAVWVPYFMVSKRVKGTFTR